MGENMHRTKKLLTHSISLLLLALILSWHPFLAPPAHARPRSPIQHIIFILKENHTFDSYFGLFPGVDGTTTGNIRTSSGTQPIPLNVAPDSPADYCHEGKCAHTDYDSGAMDAFNMEDRHWI